MNYMRILIILFLLSPLLSYSQIELKAGMKITSSVKIIKKNYRLHGAMDLSIPVIEISGENIIVDFNDALLI